MIAAPIALRVAAQTLLASCLDKHQCLNRQRLESTYAIWPWRNDSALPEKLCQAASVAGQIQHLTPYKSPYNTMTLQILLASPCAKHPMSHSAYQPSRGCSPTQSYRDTNKFCADATPCDLGAVIGRIPATMYASSQHVAQGEDGERALGQAAGIEHQEVAAVC